MKDLMRELKASLSSNKLDAKIEAAIEKLEAENAQLKAELAVRWLPIESAPGDEIVLVAGEFDGTGDWRIKCGYKDAENEHWKIFGASWKPTHWMPLPAAPGAKP